MTYNKKDAHFIGWNDGPNLTGSCSGQEEVVKKEMKALGWMTPEDSAECIAVLKDISDRLDPIDDEGDWEVLKKAEDVISKYKGAP